MGCAPHLDINIQKKLRLINPHFYAEWDIKRNKWRIMAKIAGHNPKFVTTVRDERNKYIPIDERTYSRLRKILWYNRKLREYVFELLNTEEKMKKANNEKEYDNYKQIALAIRRPVQMLARELGIVSGKAKIPYAPGYGRGLNVRPY